VLAVLEGAIQLPVTAGQARCVVCQVAIKPADATLCASCLAEYRETDGCSMIEVVRWAATCARATAIAAPRGPCARCHYDPDQRVTASWSFLICRDPPSLNQRIFNAGNSRWRYQKERDTWATELMVARGNGRIPKAKAGSRRRVTLERIYGGRMQERDLDNLVGGMKPIVDALVLQGFIVGDTAKDVELHYGQIREDGTAARGLRVLIEETAA
jgi:hypothetical protein